MTRVRPVTDEELHARFTDEELILLCVVGRKVMRTLGANRAKAMLRRALEDGDPLLPAGVDADDLDAVVDAMTVVHP